MAQRLVWTYFNGPIPDGMQVNHIDFNKQNNALSNLELVTGEGNMQHSYTPSHNRIRPWANKTTYRGRPRVTDEQKQTAKAMRASGAFIKDIAAALGLSMTHAHRISS
jgi:hypothetical protein